MYGFHQAITHTWNCVGLATIIGYGARVDVQLNSAGRGQFLRASPHRGESYGSLDLYAPGNLTMVPVLVPDPVTWMFAHLDVLAREVSSN